MPEELIQLMVFNRTSDMSSIMDRMAASAVVGENAVPFFPEIIINSEINRDPGTVMVVKDPDMAQAYRTIHRTFREEVAVRGEINSDFTSSVSDTEVSVITDGGGNTQETDPGGDSRP